MQVLRVLIKKKSNFLNEIYNQECVIYAFSIGKVSAGTLSSLLKSELQERCTLTVENLEIN